MHAPAQLLDLVVGHVRALGLGDVGGVAFECLDPGEHGLLAVVERAGERLGHGRHLGGEAPRDGLPVLGAQGRQLGQQPGDLPLLGGQHDGVAHVVEQPVGVDAGAGHGGDGALGTFQQAGGRFVEVAREHVAALVPAQLLVDLALVVGLLVVGQVVAREQHDDQRDAGHDEQQQVDADAQGAEAQHQAEEGHRADGHRGADPPAGDVRPRLGDPAGAHLEQDPAAFPEQLGVVGRHTWINHHIRHKSGS
ncbi:hypothetical protein [Nonomuraea sp. NPDC049504]|uniref:hypothetical protein n=1 Tax=Nonomuraea sp. NPDC049504 TaxID=3154729 RepID=UPI003440D6CB